MRKFSIIIALIVGIGIGMTAQSWLGKALSVNEVAAAGCTAPTFTLVQSQTDTFGCTYIYQVSSGNVWLARSLGGDKFQISIN